MRLSPKELNAITKAFEKLLDNDYQLYLFGSRTDDLKKGGDIDLLVVVAAEFKKDVVDLKSKIKVKIFESIPEQKIDITVATEAELYTDIFLKEIFGGAVRLG